MGQRQRNIHRRLRQLRKQLLKGDMAELSAIQTQIAHRQAVSGGQHVIGKDQKQLFNAVEFMGVKVQAHQPLLRMETLFYPQIFNLLRGLFDPRFLNIRRVVNQIGCFPHPLSELRQAVGVRGVFRPHHQHYIGLFRQRANRFLTVSGGITDIVFTRPDDFRETFAQRVDHIRSVIYREGGLRHKRQPGVVFHIQRPDIIG